MSNFRGGLKSAIKFPGAGEYEGGHSYTWDNGAPRVLHKRAEVATLCHESPPKETPPRVANTTYDAGGK